MDMSQDPAATGGARKRVLVVDDSFIMRNIVKQIVESDPDLEVVDTAENGLIALKKVRQIRPDVVLLDIEMPEMSGLETLRRLGLRSPCKVVILSNFVGNAASAEQMEAMRLGAAATIAKPSGSVSLDLKQMRESKIVHVLRKTLGLPPVIDAVADNAENDPPPRFLDSVDFSIGRIGDQMLDGLETGVLVFDPAGSLVRANPAARRILRGWNLTPTSTISSLCEDTDPAFGQDIRDAIEGAEAKVATDVSIAGADGEMMPARRVIRPIVVSGKPCGAMVLLDDIGHKRRLQSMLDTTLSSDVASNAINGSAAAPGAAIREVTVLAANIRGFAALARNLGAARVVDLLNEYYSYMADVVGAEDGVIDKLIGDAIVVLFGVPISHGDAADRAVAAARRMHRALKLMNELRGVPMLQIGIGLGSGPAIAGLIGQPDRMTYTVIGEPADLASRIERVSKAYGARILICGETFSRLTCPVAARRLDVVLLPGRDSPTELYEVFVDDPGPAAGEWLDAFDAGVSAYLEGDFTAAQNHLARAKELNTDDMLAVMLAQRCRRLGLASADQWTGAWKLSDR